MPKPMKISKPKELPERGRGRPRYEPTEQTRQQVSLMAACGLRRYEIYQILNISPDTFRDHHQEDFELGLAKAIAMVGSKLYKRAISDRPDSGAAQQFFLKTRGGWRESKDVQITGKDGGPIEMEHKRIIKSDDVDPEMREMLIEVLERALAMEETDVDGTAGG